MNKTFFGHPAGLFTLFFTEMWERFSYYGMRAILILFMVAKLGQENAGLGFDASRAGAIYGLYTASVYLLTLPGGWLADNIFGQRKAIWYGGIIIMLGHLSLAIPGGPTFYTGLALVAIGTGLLKANISTIVGDLYPEGGARRDAGFSIFYMGINIGSFAGQLLVGYLGESVDWHYGFGIAALGMFLGLIVFKLTEKPYLGEVGVIPKAKIDQSPGKDNKKRNTVLGVGLIALLILMLYILQTMGVVDLMSVVGVAEALSYIIVAIAFLYFSYIFIAGGLTKTEVKRVLVILFLFLGAAIFWSGFEQAGSSLNLFSERHAQRYFGPLSISEMIPILLGGIIFVLLSIFWYKKIFSQKNLIPSLKSILAVVFIGLSYIAYWLLSNISGGWEMPASWLQAANPMFIIIFAPIVGVIWVKLAAVRANPPAPLKFAFGLVSLGIGFLMMVFASNIVVSGLADGVKASAFWLLITYFFHTIGELTLSPVGLSMTTKLAPSRFSGQFMGIWFMGTALGNLFAGLFAGNFNENNVAEMPDLFMSVVTVSIGAGIFFLIMSPIIKKWIGDIV